MPELREHVPLAPLTTLRLGGPARWLATCRTADEVREALRFAADRELPVLLLGGGSNLVLPDEGWPGLVIRIGVPGLEFRPADGDADVVEVEAGAGVAWDDLVDAAVERGLSGVECLTGIPGSVGAAPMQNIGAYGQELADTLVEVACLDRESGEEVVIPAEDCDLRYRWSRFKGLDRDRFVILRVRLRLRRGTVPEIRYEELARALEEGVEGPPGTGDDARSADGDPTSGEGGAPAGADPAPEARIRRIRGAVRAIRARKSMLAGQDVRSAGSFFLNPVLSRSELERLEACWREADGEGEVPRYPADGGVKVPAAWLVERAGFEKGTARGGAAVSPDHALALVNRGGTTEELLALAREIREAVEAAFGVRLEPEPTIVRLPSRPG